MIRRHSAKSTSSQGVKGTIAATFTSTSRRPCSATVSSNIRFTSASLETSTCIVVPLCTSAPTTVAPSDSSLSATALPIPCAAPVTTATRLSSLPISPPSLELVEVRRVLVAAPRVHVVRVEDLGAVVRGDLLHACDRADAGNRIVVEPGLDPLLERVHRVRDVGREQHRRRPVDEERVVPDRVPRRLVQPEALRKLVVARHRLDVRALVVPGVVRVAEELERLVVPALRELSLVHDVPDSGALVELVAADVVDVQVRVVERRHVAEPEAAGSEL